MHSPALVVCAALMVGLNVAGSPAENALLSRYAPTSWKSRAFGAKFVLTLGVSACGVALVPVVHASVGSLNPDVFDHARLCYSSGACISYSS